MTTVIRTETRKRGLFGHLFKWLFILFNILMLVWLIIALGSAGQALNDAASEAEKAGGAIGAALGAGFIIFIWLAGAVILGLFALLTKGRTTVVEERAP